MTCWVLRLPCILVLITGLLTLAPASHSAPLETKRAEAEALERRIREQGSRLSMATEDFNAARVERERLQAQAAGAKGEVDEAEARWAALRQQLGKRARILYMHPTAAINAFLGAKTLGEVARAQVYGAEVLLTDTDLMMEAEKARHEVLERAKALDGLRREASRKEEDLAARRSQVQRELGTQRSLLGRVRGEIAGIIEAERAAQAAAAAAQAAAAQAAPAPAAQASRPSAPSEHAVVNEPSSPPPAVKGSAAKAVETARAQLGKPYEWGASGPGSFDCSGLTSYAWASAGVSLPHSSRAQYASLPKVARSQLQPGDLVFYGSPIHHVGIYEGGGIMINAPETGEFVRRNSIARSDYAGAARP